MFTGIIEGLGTISAVRPSGQGRRMHVEADFELAGTRIGDSIAVSGACLTAVTVTGRGFSVDVSPETLHMTTLNKAAVGERVNLERALRLGDRLDGHLVSGHVDGRGVIARRETLGNVILVTINIDEELSRYMIRKGSVAVDGVSLTINRCDKSSFAVSIIPQTARITTIGFKKVGQPVNIETDMIGKYVERFVALKDADPGPVSRPQGIDMDLLVRTGFL
jgi:riboflavin synthase